jgi:hypothetical protein
MFKNLILPQTSGSLSNRTGSIFTCRRVFLYDANEQTNEETQWQQIHPI